MRTMVRFGGLTTAEAVAAVPDGGAAGFVYGLEGSPRSLNAGQISSLVESLPSNVEAWGQVVDPSVETVRRLFEEVGVDRVEVHGSVPEGLEFLEIHHLIPTVVVAGEDGEAPLPTVPPAEDYPRLLLDAAGPALADGQSIRPNWELCHRIVDGQPGRKLTLSGGLEASNVAAALSAVRPWGVGVCAGVESAPGRPDPERMRAFVEAVEQGERGGGPG